MDSGQLLAHDAVRLVEATSNTKRGIEAVMFHRFGSVQSPWTQRFPRHLLHRLTTLASAASAALLAQLLCLQPLKADQTERPNVVLIMADDQGYWDTSATGNPHIETPQMERMASEGTRFSRYYAAPVCSLTRAGMMTGRYYLRTGLYNTRFGGDTLGQDETTVAERLRSAGYRTGLFGKWHLGKYSGYQPQQRGFDEFFGHYHGHIERYQHPDQIYHNGKPVEARGYVTDLFTDAALDFIESSARAAEEHSANEHQPFFCSLMYNAPHSPFLLDTSHADQPQGDELITKYLERGMPIREARIYGMIERIDQNIGRVLNKLEQLGLEENTLVIYTSDNGGVSRFWKGGMNGQKASPYEGGVRAPLFARWPGVVPSGGVVDGQTSHVDFLPTFCELAGVELPADQNLDGKSLVPLLKAGSGEQHHRYVYHTWDRYFPNPDRRWGISDQRWKLIGMFSRNAEIDPSKWRLFDLQDDPGEKKNVAEKHPEIVRRLRAEFVRWFDEVTEGKEYAPVRIPVGNADENPVVIEPSWADWQGDHIDYQFDGYDWDTLEGWKMPGEQARWRLDVHEGGEYRLWLRYGCRPLDAGGQLRVTAEESSLTHTVQATATANQFERFDGGILRLEPGPVELVAEVVSAPEQELMRLVAIELEKLPSER